LAGLLAPLGAVAGAVCAEPMLGDSAMDTTVASRALAKTEDLEIRM
jgi:hypothetical protein